MAAEPAKVRLVLCPKCQNLLPEIADYSVYQCGGCGAVLRAKNRNFAVDALSEKSDEERVQGVSEKIPEKSDNCNFLDKGMNLSDGSEYDVRSNASSRTADKREVLSNMVDKQRNGSSFKADNWFVDNGLEMKENLYDSTAEMGRKSEELKASKGITNGSRRSGQFDDWRSGEENELGEFWRKPRRDVHGQRISSAKYSEDGPSNYDLRSSYGHGESGDNQNNTDDFNKVEYLEQDKVELLRKLDELKDQLSRSCDVNGKPKEKAPLDRRLDCQEEPYGGDQRKTSPWYPDGSWRSNRASSHYSMSDPYAARPPYGSHYPEQLPYMNRYEMDMYSFYPSMHAPSAVQRLGDPLGSQMLRRAPHQAPSAFLPRPSHPYFSGQYIDDVNQFDPYPPNMMKLHHPSCSCFHCYNKYPKAPTPVPPSTFRNKMFPDVPNNPIFYHPENPSAFGPQDYNSEIANLRPLSSHGFQSHSRWPSEFDSEVGGFVRFRPPRVVVPTGGRYCWPIAGGAPFVTCHNCFALLQLPKKLLPMEKNEKKLQCGACSTVIRFVVVNEKLVFVHDETKTTPKVVDDRPNATVSGGAPHFHVQANHGSMNFSSDDYENSGYDFQSMDREVNSPSTGQGFYSGKSAEMGSIHSISPYCSEAEVSPESLNAQREDSNSAVLAAKANTSPPLAGSPLQEHFDDSNKYCSVNRFGKGDRSGRSEQEKGEPKKVTSRQNSMKDASLETEMTVSFNGYSNTGTSQESGDASREVQPRSNKGGQSFFAGIIKKSFRDFSRSNQTIEQSSTQVTINGHLIPERVLRKAEKLSGPVHPGQYWYDFRAGFWGVMGGPCVGIIPPYIEEFNYPMPQKCSGGNTGVFVNGRELNPKDLNLLSGRGLPSTRDRSFIIEISGRVLDEDSGEELDGLGKLAPTIEKLKHGFGMKVPRVAS